MSDDKNRVIAPRLVPDPYLTDAEYFAQRQKRSGANVGKVVVEINLAELIGGLARIEHTDAQEQAAARFRGLHERAQIGGARAIDYAAVKVDTSGPAGHLVFEVGAQARAAYADACAFLGSERARLLEKVIVYGHGIGAVVGRNAKARRDASKALLAALDELAVFFGLSARPR